MELNEIGFTVKDVISITNTGLSSKAKSTETTGEKGIGFKSVFGVADKVQVKSGFWSFRFEHKQGDDGLGMITPLFDSSNTTTSTHKTTITLCLSDTSHEVMQKLCCRLEELSATLLYALRKIKKISIVFDNVLGRSKQHMFEKPSSRNENELEIVSNIDGHIENCAFRTWQTITKDMPACQQSRCSESVIRIAFPVESLSKPKPLLCQEGWHYYAFLPVARLSQLPFLIHADFILAANRQAVVDNSWNQRLRLEIAQLFAHAVEQIVQGDVQRLSLTWMRLLPLNQIDGFWSPLFASIQQALGSKIIFHTCDGQKIKASFARLLPAEFLHKKRPLLEMKPTKVAFGFLSQDYDSSDHATLKRLGIETLSTDEMIDLVHQDLESGDPHLMNTPFTDTWHDTFLRLLATLKRTVDRYPNRCASKTFNNLKIVPVMNDRSSEWWAISSAKEIFLPNVFEGGSGADKITIQIPTDVGLPTVRTAACSSAQRKAFYRQIGVQDCSSERLCDAILAHQHDGKSKWPDDLLRYLEVLFWFSYDMDYSTRSSLQAYRMGADYGNAKGLFFQSDKPYDAAQLLRPHENPKQRKYFLSPEYQNSPVSSRVRGNLTWEVWLKDVVGVRWFPPLQDNARCGLHPAVRMVLEENPREFIPMLQAYWAAEYADTCRTHPKIKTALQTSLVLCQTGKKVELQKTWFPSPGVLEEVKKFGIEQRLPLLDLPQWHQGSDITSWACLTDLDVPAHPQILLYKQILLTLKQHREVKTSIETMESLYHIIGKQANMDSQKDLQVGNMSIVEHPAYGK